MTSSDKSKKLGYDESINDLTELVLQGIEEEYYSEFEPLAVYTNRLRARIHSEVNDYRGRCARGYLVLLEELKHEGQDGQ